MKKRLLAVMLTGVISMGLLAGCGSSSGKDVESETTKKNGSNTLTVWCWDPTYNMNALNKATEIYQKEHPDFKLDIVETDEQTIMTKLATASTSGDTSVLPDILLLNDANFQLEVGSYPDCFTDLTASGFNYDEFSEGKVAMSMVDDKNYGIPFDNGTAIACYRTDILQKAGFTIQDFTDITWSEWLQKAKVVLDKTGCPLLNGLSCYNQLTIMLQSAGGSYFNKDGTPNITNNEVLKRTIETYTEMVNSGVYTEETGWDTYVGGMNTGRIAGAMNGCWIMSSIRSAEDQSGLWQITNIPKLDNVDNATNYSSQGGSTWAITSNCSDVDLAVDFFKSTFGSSKELYDDILETGAISTWLPAADSEKYSEPNEYFCDQPVFSMITNYSENVPQCYVGVYFQNAQTDVANAITNILYSGGKLDDELANAEETLKFEMEQN